MKPLLLGEAPGPGGGYHDPLGKKTARRLCLLAGWDPVPGTDPYREALLLRFELRNLLDHEPERQGKGKKFPKLEGREAARALELNDRTVVALGKRVAEALEVPTDYFQWQMLRGGSAVIVIPHPSGINRVLNDERVRQRTGNILRHVAERMEHNA